MLRQKRRPCGKCEPITYWFIMTLRRVNSFLPQSL
jgi:hypothetical protein